MERTITKRLRQILLTAITATTLAPALQAQVANYTFLQSSTTYSPVTGGTVVAQATGSAAGQRLNDGNFTVTLPFTFDYNGTGYTAVNVNANGYITFGNTAPAAGLTTPISSGTGYSGAVSAFGADIEGVYEVTATTVMGSSRLTSVSRLSGLKPGQTVMGTGIPANTTITSTTNGDIILSNPAGTGGPTTITAITGTISTQTSGTAPNRVFTIQWDGFRLVNVPNSLLNFQIQLTEGGGVATAQSAIVVYGPSTLAGAGTAEIGLRGAANTDYNNRAGVLDLTNTVIGTANNAIVTYNANTVVPGGLTYRWSRQGLAACNGAPVAGAAISSSPSSCSGNLVLMSPGASTGTGITYQWQSSSAVNGPYTDITGATNNPYMAASQNSVIFYRLNVKCLNNNTTTSSSPIGVSKDPLNVRLGNDTVLCPGTMLDLNAGNPGVNFTWSTGSSTQEVSIAAAGTYSVTATDPVSGCIGRDTIVVRAGQVPVVNLGADRAICDRTSVVLNAANTGSSFMWNTGATTQSITVSRAGTFYVKVTNADRCASTDTINITVDPLPSAFGISYNGVMPTMNFSVAAPNNVSSYFWNFDDNGATATSPTPTHTFSRLGNFNVRVVVSNNCGSDTLTEVIRITSLSAGGVKLSADDISVYPNPAGSYVMLSGKGGLKLQEVQVVNMIGATVLLQTGNGTGMKLVTDALPAGAYLLRMVTDRGTATRQLQIMR